MVRRPVLGFAAVSLIWGMENVQRKGQAIRRVEMEEKGKDFLAHLNIYPSYIHLGRGPCPAASFARTRRRRRKSTGDCRRRARNDGRATTVVASPFPGAPTTDGCRRNRHHLPLRSWNAGHPSRGMPCWRPGRANSSTTGRTRVHSLVLNHIWRSSAGEVNG